MLGKFNQSHADRDDNGEWMLYQFSCSWETWDLGTASEETEILE